MQLIRELTHNYILNCAVLGWLLAQLLKAVYVWIATKKFVPERLFGPGGMPSSHSACVSALALAVCRSEGFSSPAFAIAFILACVVMYDATSVRRQAGEHGRAINLMMDKIEDLEDPDDPDRDQDDRESVEFKEVLGHKPIEVLAGALLGILIALVVPM